MPKDLHILPKVRDSWSYLYVEHCRVDQEDKAIAVHDVNGRVPVPCATLGLLMLGPGTTVTHAAVRTLGWRKGAPWIAGRGFERLGQRLSNWAER